MADLTQIKYLSLTGLVTYDQKIKAFVESKVSEGDAKSFKYVNLVDGVLKFYTVNPIAEDTVADFEIELPEQDLSNLMQLVKDATEGNIAAFGANGQVVDGGVAVADLATKAEVEAVSDKADANESDITTLKGKVEALEAGTYDDTEIRELVQGNADAIDAIEKDYLKAADKAELAGQIAAVDAKADENAAAIKTISDDYLKAADKEALQDQIDANVDAIEVLNGDSTVEGSVDKKVADAINAFATQITDNDTIDTFKEVLNYIANHGGEAAEMMAAIDDLETLVGEKSVATQIAEAIAAENLEQYATDEELAEAVARIVVLEGKAHEHANKAELDLIETGDKAKWDEAADKAHEHENKDLLDTYTQTEADLADAVAKKHAHENADVLAGITAEKVAAWDAAEGNVKAYVDEKIADEVEARNTAIATAKQEAIDAAGTAADTKDAAVLADAKAYTEEKVAAIDLSGIETNAGNITALQEDVAELQAVQHVEISTDEINALFPEA